eukprot:COSAG05_NODE_486_length_9342_cov_20.072271_3_plen_89_part_00
MCLRAAISGLGYGCIVFLDHVQNLQIHVMRAKFHIVFSIRILEAGHSDLRARPEAGTLGSPAERERETNMYVDDVRCTCHAAGEKNGL